MEYTYSLGRIYIMLMLFRLVAVNRLYAYGDRIHSIIMFTYYDDQKTFDLCINWSRGYKEKRNKEQRKEKKKKKKNEKKIIDMSRLYTMCVGPKDSGYSVIP